MRSMEAIKELADDFVNSCDSVSPGYGNS
jgi:hypothetical protein